MPALSPQSQAVITAFGRESGVTPDQVRNLQDIINGAPALIDQFNDAVAQGHLKRIVPLPHANAGGEYSAQGDEMRLPLMKLTSPPNVGDMTFVLGHELQHGLNATNVEKAGYDFAKEVRGIAKSRGQVHDYTSAVAKLLLENRSDEASAEIAGWNAVVSAVKSTNSSPTLGDIYEFAPGRMADFVDRSGNKPNYTYMLKPNLSHSLNADMTMSPTPTNVEAMGQNYFDKAAGVAKLGARGTSDYVNYYGGTLVGYVAEVERSYNPPKPGLTPPQMTFDMAQLRLSEKLLEEKGIDLGKGNAGQQTYYDSSVNPPTAHLFQHTIGTHQHTNPVLAQTIKEDRAQATPARSPADPDHPDHKLLEKLQGCVRGLDQQAGKGWDENSERLTASALAMAKKMGFTAQDDLQLSCNTPTGKYAGGELLFVSRHGPTASPDPAANLIYMPVAEALSKPAQERYQEVEAINQTQAETMRMPQQQTIAPDDPTRGGPVMRM